MWNFFKFIARFGGGGVVSFATPHILRALGVPLDQWIARIVGFIENPPHWFNYDFVYWCLVALLGILIISLTYIIPSIIHKRKGKPTQQNIQEETEVNKNNQEINTALLEAGRDVWLLDAIHYILFRSWDSIPENLESEKYLIVMDRARQELQQNAFDGLLPIWGKKFMASIFREIEPEYWEHNIIDLESLLKDEPEELKTSLASPLGGGFGYTHLMTSKAKVEELWPSSIKSEIKPDTDMCDAMDHVASVEFPDLEPNVINYDREYKEVGKLITGKLRSGELTAWGKRIEIVAEYGRQEYKPYSTNSDILFKKEDWEFRELIPISACIPSDHRPQTESFGSGEDHIQLTALRVNRKQVEKLWH